MPDVGRICFDTVYLRGKGRFIFEEPVGWLIAYPRGNMTAVLYYEGIPKQRLHNEEFWY